MNTEMFIARIFASNGDTKTEKYIIGLENLDKCVKALKREYNNAPVYVNKAVICFDGYMNNGDYIGQF